MDIREEVPIKSFSIAAYICKVLNGVGRYLIIRRSAPYLSHSWQMVSGRIEKGETAWQAALREMKEETGLIPDRLYSANELEMFYEVNQNCINLVPTFVGFIDSDQEVSISGEHTEYKWIAVDEADGYLIFEHQKKMMKKIEEQFVRQEPNDFLRIKTNKNI